MREPTVEAQLYQTASFFNAKADSKSAAAMVGAAMKDKFRTVGDDGPL